MWLVFLFIQSLILDLHLHRQDLSCIFLATCFSHIILVIFLHLFITLISAKLLSLYLLLYISHILYKYTTSFLRKIASEYTIEAKNVFNSWEIDFILTFASKNIIRLIISYKSCQRLIKNLFFLQNFRLRELQIKHCMTLLAI